MFLSSCTVVLLRLVGGAEHAAPPHAPLVVGRYPPAPVATPGPERALTPLDPRRDAGRIPPWRSPWSACRSSTSAATPARQPASTPRSTTPSTASTAGRPTSASPATANR